MVKEAASSAEKAKKVNRKQLGQMLIEQGLLTPDELSDALEVQSKHGGRLGEIIVQQGLIDQDVLLDVLSLQLNVPVVDVKGRKISQEALSLIPEAMARQQSIIPLEVVEGRLLIAMAYPDDIGIINDIKAMTTMRVEIALASPTDIERTIDLNYRSSTELEKQIDQFEISKERQKKTMATSREPTASALARAEPVTRSLIPSMLET